MAVGPGAVDVAHLVNTLGKSVIRPLSHDDPMETAIAAPVIYDVDDDIPDVPGGVLLLVGSGPDEDVTLRALQAAGQHGMGAVVVKLRGRSTDRLSKVAAEAECTVLVADDTVPWHRIDQLIAAAVAAGARTRDSSQELFTLANTVAQALDGAVAIEDLDRNILAYSNLDGHEIDPIRRNGILARRVPYSPKNEEQYREVYRTRGIVHLPSDSGASELGRCAVAIRAGRQILGTIWVIERGGSISPVASKVLVEASHLAAIGLLQRQDTQDIDRQLRNEWLRSLLEGYASEGGPHVRDAVLDLQSSVLAAFMMRPGAEHQALTGQLATSVEQYFTVFRASVPLVSIGAVVYTLLPAAGESRGPLRATQNCVVAAEARLGRDVLAAVSSPARRGTRLLELRREVDSILRVLLTDESTRRNVATSHDVHAALFLRRIAAEIPREDRVQYSGLRKLMAHDRRRGTAYRDTLFCYLVCMGDISTAAKRLNVHPNTVRYRVHQIREKFDLKLESPDDILVLWLSLRLESMQDEATSSPADATPGHRPG